MDEKKKLQAGRMLTRPVKWEMDVKKKCKHCGHFNTYKLTTYQIDKAVFLATLLRAKQMVDQIQEDVKDVKTDEHIGSDV